MWDSEQILTDKNNRVFVPTDPYRNRSRQSRLLVLQGVEYSDNVGRDIFLFGPSDRPTDHLVRCAFLAVTDELFQLPGLGQIAELDRAVDAQCPFFQGSYQSRVRPLDNRPDVADITVTNPRGEGNLFSYINVLSFRQI